MSSIILLAETGSDISPGLAEQYGIRLVPMHVTFGNTVKDDGTFPNSEVVSYYRTSGKLPSTSGSNEMDFEEVFDQIHQQYPDSGILHLAYSAVTTCSYGCAVSAAANRPYVRSVDTKLVSAGQCAVVIRMAELLREHPEWDLDTAAAEAERISRLTHFFFLPTNLRFLQAGGRVSNAAAIFGTVLRIIPCVDLIDGYLVAGKKYRGRLESVLEKAIKDFLKNHTPDLSDIWFVITPETSEAVREKAEAFSESMGFQQVHFLDSGGVITTHGGPNAIGISVLTRE